MTENLSNPMQIIIDEFKNISGEITNSSFFNLDCEIFARMQTTNEEQIKKTVFMLKNMVNRAVTIGGFETLTIQGVNSQLDIMYIRNRYFLTVSSRAADEKTVKALTQVIVPTVVKLMDQKIPIELSKGNLVMVKSVIAEVE